MFEQLKWRKRLVALDVYQALRPVFLMCKCFGTYNYSHSKINKLLLRCFTILLTLFITLATTYALEFIDLVEAEWYENLVYFYIEKTQITLTYICFIVTISMHAIRQEKIGKELLSIRNIDLLLKKQNFKFIYSTLNHLWVSSMLVTTALLTWFIDFWFYTNSGSFYAKVELLSCYFPLLVIYSSMAQWYSIIKILGDHFVHITISALSTPCPDRLSILVKVHGRLCTVSRAINELFGPCLLIWTLFAFVMMTEYLFIAMKVAFQQTYNYTGVSALIIFVFVRFMNMWVVVSTCERTSTEVRTLITFNLTKLI